MVNEKLMVAVYHHIRENPDHWDQRHWACSTGMCCAGWALTLSGSQWRATESGCSWMPLGTFSWSIPDAAARCLGLDPEIEIPLFNATNTLPDIRRIMTGLLGYDPESVLPDEDFVLEGKRAAYRYYGSGAETDLV